MPEILPSAAVTDLADAPTSYWLTADQAAKHANLSTRTIYSAARSKRLRSAVVGGRRSRRFRIEWIDAWMEAETTPIEVQERAATLRVAGR